MRNQDRFQFYPAPCGCEYSFEHGEQRCPYHQLLHKHHRQLLPSWWNHPGARLDARTRQRRFTPSSKGA